MSPFSRGLPALLVGIFLLPLVCGQQNATYCTETDILAITVHAASLLHCADATSDFCPSGCAQSLNAVHGAVWRCNLSEDVLIHLPGLQNALSNALLSCLNETVPVCDTNTLSVLTTRINEAFEDECLRLVADNQCTPECADALGRETFSDCSNRPCLDQIYSKHDVISPEDVELLCFDSTTDCEDWWKTEPVCTEEGEKQTQYLMYELLETHCAGFLETHLCPVECRDVLDVIELYWGCYTNPCLDMLDTEVHDEGENGDESHGFYGHAYDLSMACYGLTFPCEEWWLDTDFCEDPYYSPSMLSEEIVEKFASVCAGAEWIDAQTYTCPPGCADVMANLTGIYYSCGRDADFREHVGEANATLMHNAHLACIPGGLLPLDDGNENACTMEDLIVLNEAEEELYACASVTEVICAPECQEAFLPVQDEYIRCQDNSLLPEESKAMLDVALAACSSNVTFDECECISELPEGVTDPVMMELGSLYDLYMNDVVHIEREFRAHASIVNKPIPHCCIGDYSFTAQDTWKPYVAVLTVWFTLVAIFTPLLWIRRKMYPLHCRNVWINFCLIAWNSFVVTFVVILHNAGPTAPCLMMLILSLVFFPLSNYTYLVKCYHLYFVYNWSLVKGDESKSKWYHNHKHFLNMKTFFIGVITLMVFGFLLSLVIAAIEPGLFDAGTSYYESARCEWWIIDEEVKASASALGVPVILPMPHDYDSDSSTEYVAHMSECTFCLKVHLALVAFVLAYNILQVVMLLYALISIRKLNDQNYIFTEIVCYLLVGIPLATVIIASLMPQVDWTDQDPSPDLICNLIIMFWSFCCSIIHPVFVSYLDGDGSLMSLLRAPASKERASDGKLFSLTLDDILADAHLFLLYKDFAVKEFTVENILFLYTLQQLPAPSAEPGKFLAAAERVGALFFKDDSALEVNIASQTNKDYWEAMCVEQRDPETVHAALMQAAADIRQLILTDSWPRFEHSKQFESCIKYRVNSIELQHAMNKIGNV
eukprot:Rmarinus@m.454